MVKKSGLYVGFLAVSLALVSVVFVAGLLTTSRTLSSFLRSWVLV